MISKRSFRPWAAVARTSRGTCILALGLLLWPAPAVQAAPWRLVWSDEFDYHGLPDPARWDYEEGFVRNGESQYYTRARRENARVEDGHLIIECRHEHFTPAGHAPVEYTAASLITRNKFNWQYGRLEVRAKLPRGRGVWPAVWTLGTNIDQVGWPACGEVDVMEFVGKETNRIHGTVHYALAGKHQSSGQALDTPRPDEAFHVYALEWTPERMDFFFDRQKYHTVLLDQAGAGADNSLRKPHYLLINFALGGSWGGPIDDSLLPQQFVIDYVRVYQAGAPGKP